MGKFWDWIKEPLSDAGIFAAVQLLMKEGLRKVAEHGAEHTARHVKNTVFFEDLRGELLAQIAMMQAANVDIGNMLRRHQEAKDKGEEARFIKLISKIPRKQWWVTLKFLNQQQDDKTFNQLMYWLEDDRAGQHAHQLTKWARQYFEKGSIFTEKALFASITSINKASDQITGSLSKSAALFEKRERARQRAKKKQGVPILQWLWQRLWPRPQGGS